MAALGPLSIKIMRLDEFSSYNSKVPVILEGSFLRCGCLAEDGTPGLTGRQRNKDWNDDWVGMTRKVGENPEKCKNP